MDVWTAAEWAGPGFGGSGDFGAIGVRQPGRIQVRCFTLLPRERLLLKDGVPIDIGSRAFDLFNALLVSPGAVVERAELVRRVWPTTTVEESNLRFQVGCLRKVLGEDSDLVKTVPGRGYLIAADVSVAGADQEPGGRQAGGHDDLRSLLHEVLAELRVARGRHAAVSDPSG